MRFSFITNYDKLFFLLLLYIKIIALLLLVQHLLLRESNDLNGESTIKLYVVGIIAIAI